MSNETMNKKSLFDRVKEFDSRLPFMDGREKGKTEDLIGTVNTIRDFGFLPNDRGEQYAAFIVDERPDKFYFGGTVLTDRLTQLEAEGYHDDVVELGLPMVMTEQKSRNGRSFVNVKFNPED